MTIRLQLRWLAVIGICGLLVFAAVAFTALSQIEVNGPLYRTISLSSDLIADYVPPSESLLQPALLCAKLTDAPDQDSRRRYAEQLKAFQSEFDRKHADYMTRVPEGDLKAMMRGEAYETAQEYFRLSDQLVELVNQNRGDEARTLLVSTMNPLYDRHTAAVDQIVIRANKEARATEALAARSVRVFTAAMVAIGLLVLIAVASLSWFISREIGAQAEKLIVSVSGRQGAEKALLQEKTFSDAVIDAIPGLFFFQDEVGKNLRWNKNAEMLVRHAPSEAAPLLNVAEEYKHVAAQAQQEIFTTGSGEGELEMLAKSGQRIPYYFSGVRVELEGQPHLAIIGVDITRLREAEKGLRVSEAEFRSFVEHAPYGIGRTSVNEDRFLNANPALVKMLGYRSETEVQGLKVSRDLYFEADSRGFRAQPTRADYFSGVEFTWKRKDGRPINVRASGRRLSDKHQGEIIELIVEDVSARRVLEEQLRQAQKMEALGQLAGSVAHDFNNLLAVIIGYSDILAAAASTDAMSRSRVEIIKNAGERAASLTAQLLAFSRRSVMQPRVVHLNSLVMETAKMLERLMGEDVEQVLSLDPNLGRTRADPGQMVQVIMNLAVNARDAMPGGGQLTIETAPVFFQEDTTMQDVALPAGRYVMLAVSDTGIGMDAKTQARIFEPFFTTKPDGKGTGLGLATVYGIVKQSGGFIFASSALGEGTTFKVYLPQVEQSAEAAAKRTPPTEMSRERVETILLVEDEIAFRELLQEGLQSNGYHVLVGENGVHALRVAEEHQGPISLLITDVIMPQMSGPELAKRLKEVRPEIQVLYMSGYTDDKLAHMANPDGDLALMQKPFYVHELVKKARELIALQDPDRNDVVGNDRLL